VRLVRLVRTFFQNKSAPSGSRSTRRRGSRTIMRRRDIHCTFILILTSCVQVRRTAIFEQSFRISEPGCCQRQAVNSCYRSASGLSGRKPADLPNTRNALDETACAGVNWLIHVSFNLALTSWKGEPGFGIHTRTAAHEPNTHTAIHFSVS
jgi:hypothetical protein